MEHSLLTLPEPRPSKEVRRNDDPKSCLYHLRIILPIKDWFVVKDRIKDMVDNHVIGLPSNSIKVVMNQDIEMEAIWGNYKELDNLDE